MTTAVVEPKRDRWGRYLLPDPETGKERAWTRVTTFAKAIGDTFALTRWGEQRVVLGMGQRDDLVALASTATPEDKTTLNEIIEAAKEVSEAHFGRRMGTAIHEATAQVDLGKKPSIPEPWLADVRAYRAALREAQIGIHPEWVERIVVLPDLGVAGTLDRIVAVNGKLMIGDIKTGKSLFWENIVIQLACYANAPLAWTGTEYEPLPEVDTTEAVVMHLQAGQASCELYKVDIASGWEAAKVCRWVRSWRGRKDLHAPLNGAGPGPS